MNRLITNLNLRQCCMSQNYMSLYRTFSSYQPILSVKSIKFLKSQRRRQKNEAKQAMLKNNLDRVDPVFGKKETPFIVRIMAELKEPGVLSHGYSIEEIDKLLATIESTEREQADLSGLNTELFETDSLKTVEARREALLRILSMRNAANQESIKMAVALARKEFERFDGDTGSSEVQAACLTVRILNMAKHVQEHKKDFANTRTLRMLVQQRQSILRYLKRDNPQCYYRTIEKLGLDDAAIMDEFNMDRRYMQEYKFFGDKILIKDSKRILEQKRKDLKKQKLGTEINEL